MCMQTPWEKTLEFHGKVCPGLVVGFRAAEAGMRELGVEAPGSVDVVAIVENQGCGADAVQVVTGCTFGKGSLIFHDYGKQVYTFIRRDTGQAMRVACRMEAFARGGVLKDLYEAWRQAPTADSERALDRKREQMADQLMEMPEAELLDIRPVQVPAPTRPGMENTLRCSCCGEEVAENRTRTVAGQTVCLPCAGAQKEVS